MSKLLPFVMISYGSTHADVFKTYDFAWHILVITSGRLMKTTAVVFIRRKSQNFIDSFYDQAGVFHSLYFAYT